MKRGAFETLADGIFGQLRSGEDALLHLQSESSDFVRFNRGRVRQPGHVDHAKLRLQLIRGQRHTALEFNVGTDEDLARATTALGRLREQLEVLQDDPHLLWETAGRSTEYVQPGEPVSAEALVDAILEEAGDHDMVGILAAGPQATGFANSRGQRNWDQRHSWLYDWCLYHRGDKAVKSTVGGRGLELGPLKARFEAVREQLPILGRPVRRLDPESYRVFLAPAAVGELLDLVSRDGFSHRAHQTHSSALGRLARGEATLSEKLHLVEDIAGGLGPGFSEHGFAKPDRVELIRGGRLGETLVSPRSARQYGVSTTGSGHWEAPDALAMAGGELADESVFEALGTGLYVSNLWYLNYSDHPRGRITGMTRFATLWVEDGRPTAPAEVMRFDDTIFHLLGDRLEGLGRQVELLPSADTYGMRSTSSQRVPGALIDGMRFPL